MQPDPITQFVHAREVERCSDLPYEARQPIGAGWELVAATNSEAVAKGWVTARCGDCHVHPGERHEDGCDVARCTECGFQRIGCGCPDTAGWGQVWTGRWPGDVEVDEGIATDLNDLARKAHHGQLVWDRPGQRWRAR